MTEFDPAPANERDDGSRWRGGAETFDRVYDVLLGITSPTPYAEIADRADCSANAAKKHLDRLAEMGIARTDPDRQPASYVRNDGYLEWQEASRIARQLTTDEIVERVQELEAERESYETRFHASDPVSVSVFDGADHEAVHERMRAVTDWHAVVRDLRLYELAGQLSRNDGHLIPA